jgi:hypothetical protein
VATCDQGRVVEVLNRRDLVAAGRPIGFLRGPKWHLSSRGIYVPASVDLTLLTRCQALRTILPDGSVFGELTAAALYGWWLPPLPMTAPITVITPPDANRIRRHDVRARRSLLPAEGVQRIGELAVTSPIRTLRDLAATLGLVDLVVLGDSAVRLGSYNSAQLEEAANCEGGRGIRMFRRAVPLIDARSESPWETVLRLMHVIPGLPPVEPQAELVDAAGNWVARGDLWLVALAVSTSTTVRRIGNATGIIMILLARSA